MPLFAPARGVATGSILPHGSTTAPMDFLLCDGSVVSQTTYATLFGVIGTGFNTGGEGAGNFRLPDMRGKFILGQATSGTGSTFAGIGGAIDHLHTVNLPSITTSGPSATAVAVALLGSVASATHTHNFDAAAVDSNTVNPPFIVTVYIIRI